jgi:hypothetical protein
MLVRKLRTLAPVFLGFLFVCSAVPTAAQVKDSTALAVFLDCDRCDFEYIRRQIAFVDYVRDRTQSDVHLLITVERTGAGRAYTLTFIGRRDFEGLADTLHYTSSSTDSDDERREGLTRVIKLGLVRYVARTPAANQVIVDFDSAGRRSSQTLASDDPWKSWVFRVGLNGSVDAEEVTDEYEVEVDVQASRVTEDWKIRVSLDAGYEEQHFDLEEGTITSTRRDGSLRALAVNSIGRQWSAGAFARISTSSFNNTALSASFSPAIEYNLFPYSESTRRQLRISYFLAMRAFDYEEETIRGETSEWLLRQQLTARLEFEQPWGEASAWFEASNYLTDFEKSLLDLYRLELFGFLEVRVVRGLSLFIFGNVSRIRDQVFLPLEEASEEEILLGNVRLPTSFEYGLSLGVSYTFGSIYNNIVNPRFGS